MRIQYYVFSEERRQLQREAVEHIVANIEGPIGFYEWWPGEEPQLMITDEALEAWRPFCSLIWKDDKRKELCHQDYEKRAAACTQPEIGLCLAGVHNVACPVKDKHGGIVTLIGGEFRLCEEKTKAERKLYQFLESQGIPSSQRDKFYEAWNDLPEVSKATVFGQIMRELELAGYDYLHSLRQLTRFRYSADLVSHDLIITLQSLIASTEVLKIELTRTFGIGKKWGERFEEIIQTCERFYSYLQARLGFLGEPEYTHESIGQLIHECIDCYRAKAKGRWIDFPVELEKIKGEDGKLKTPEIRMARTYLSRAFHNVIDNAVKYSFDGTADHPRWIDVVGRFETRQGVPGYAIQINDLGIGIEEDELERVFEPGYQGNLRRGEFRPGAGMGLAFAKECVEMHGGTILIHSRPEKRTGWLTTVHIWLPIHGPTDRQ